MSGLLLCVTGLALSVLVAHGAHRLVHVALFLRRRKPVRPAADDGLVVTVQLPLYRERAVARRLLRAVGELDWPRERLEIQVLDDSDDETREVVDAEVARLRARGLDAVILRRTQRTGFKAGALAAGLARARGELVAVFDADFVPRPDFLRRAVGAFRDPGVGLVQARWGHLNRDESLLTRAQAALLDGHFVIEHRARYDAGLLFNFNGTAGVWRRAAIEDAGGWSADTLTEDLDLSYRAQLAGWRFVYASDVLVPAEVPAQLGAFQSQQARWAQGSVQVLRKLGVQLARAPLPLRQRAEGCAHLAGNVGHPALLVLALCVPFTARLEAALPRALQLAAFTCCTVAVALFYELAQRAAGRSRGQRVVDTAAAMALGIGLCVSQTRAVLAGLRRGATPFVRTPKDGGAVRATYRAARNPLAGVELALAGLFAWAAVDAVLAGRFGALPFLGLFLWGFAWVGGLGVAARLERRSPRRATAAARPGYGAGLE